MSLTIANAGAARPARWSECSHTLERIFAREAHMPFAVWRYRQRMLFALERLAYGERVALEAAYASLSSFATASHHVCNYASKTLQH